MRSWGGLLGPGAIIPSYPLISHISTHPIPSHQFISSRLSIELKNSDCGLSLKVMLRCVQDSGCSVAIASANGNWDKLTKVRASRFKDTGFEFSKEFVFCFEGAYESGWHRIQ